VHLKVNAAGVEKQLLSSPVLSVKASIEKMKTEDGFEVKEVASEPLVIAPVAIDFDEKGRIWVVEMEGYMPDTAGTGEDRRKGRIVILEDTDKNGVMDKRRIFLDSLIMPRALCLIENGLLIAEPPNLWFVEINNLHAGNKILVDSRYAVGGNPEHQPNGLLRSLDNWIYSADGNKRYRKNGRRWLTATSLSRGQWGISQDDLGRLFYNNNTQNLIGDYFSASFGKENNEGFNADIVPDNNVFPIHATPGVNRGYMKGILDDSLRLRNFTAASGPVIYRGDLFGSDYYQNAFVAEPAANLIKRNILSEHGYRVTGKQAYHNKEFLASSDERFRPVTLYNGPDGALYIVDMYRGIIQHKTFLTDYLKTEIRSRKLSDPLTCGRIYKVVPVNNTDTPVTFFTDPHQLIKLLGHRNGWVRDKAQQLIIDKKYNQLIPELKNNLKLTGQPLLVIHSLWTLEGLHALKTANIAPLINDPSWKIRTQAITAARSVLTKKNHREINQLISRNDSITIIYKGFLFDNVKKKDTGISKILKIKFPKGYELFNTVCKTCHGQDGNGLKSLAPPLNGSEWVTGDKDKLIEIVLYGLTGPVKVKGKTYAPPEISSEMPGIGSNKEYNDDQVAQVLSLIRQSWSNSAQTIKASDITRIRNKNKITNLPRHAD